MNDFFDASDNPIPQNSRARSSNINDLRTELEWTFDKLPSQIEVDILKGATLTTAELNILSGATVTTQELNLLDGLAADASELNILDGATVTTEELNLLDGLTADAVELNILDGATVTTEELNLLDGLTGSLNGLTATAAELNTLDGVTASTAEINLLDGVTATTVEINHVDGVTSNIQIQLDGKLTASGGTTTDQYLAGIPTADTAPSSTDSEQLATTQFVQNAAFNSAINKTRLYFWSQL